MGCIQKMLHQSPHKLLCTLKFSVSSVYSHQLLSITFLILCLSHAPYKNYKILFRNTKSENSKSCLDYIFQTSSKYKRKFTPNFTVSKSCLWFVYLYVVVITADLGVSALPRYMKQGCLGKI